MAFWAIAAIILLILLLRFGSRFVFVGVMRRLAVKNTLTPGRLAIAIMMVGPVLGVWILAAPALVLGGFSRDLVGILCAITALNVILGLPIAYFIAKMMRPSL